MDTSFHRGWLVCEQRVQCGNVFLSPWFFLKQFCFVRRPDCEHRTVWANLRLSFAPCICVFSTARCVHNICFFVASFALWFCACAILLSIALTDDDIRIQGGILNWEISSWRGNLPQTIGEQLVQKPQSCSAQVSPKRGTNREWSGKNSWKWWLVWRMALCTQAPLSFWLSPVWHDKMGNGKLI